MSDPKPKRRIVAEDRIPGPVLPDLARWMVEESRVLTAEASPFRARLVPGDPRLVLMVGENASGKSLAFRLLCQLAGNHGITPITLSIRERTGVGTGGMEHMRRAFIYGDEHENSTGATSAGVVAAGFSNLDREKPAILGLDEPEIGLSDGYAEALGEYIGRRATEAGPLACGVAVVTHSRHLARGIVRGLGAEPTLLSTSGDHDGVAGWIASEEVRTVEELLALKEVGLDRWRTVNRLLDRR